LNIFAALEQGDCQTIILDHNDDVILLAAVACFMWKELTRVNGYFEVTIPAYLSGEFENHFRIIDTRNKAHWVESNWQFIWAARNFARKTNAAVSLECGKQGTELYRTSADTR